MKLKAIYVGTFVKDHRKTIGNCTLSLDNWGILREINVRLKPFEKATITQGTTECSV
jgi:hypothetical protein